MTTFWHWFVVVLTVGFLVATVWLLVVTRRVKDDVHEGDTPKVMPHSYDGIQEYNNPLPRWWLNLFYITVVFGVVYLLAYPGLGNFKGFLNWTQEKEVAQELKAAQEKYAPLFAKYQKIDIPTLAQKHPEAIEMGKRIFLNNCAVCHGSDGRGSPGFPNLTDNDWLWGGSPEQIVASITHGRQGNMPAWKATLGDAGVEAMVSYVFKLSGRKHNASLAAEGEKKFAMFCAACHGPDGKGNQAVGAPNLTDNIWLYGGSPAVIRKTIAEGRSGRMPAHKDILGEAKIHLVAAYVYSLSHNESQQ
ncbi:MAG: cytochrome-c oxidase, cbb3-type subunit III [Gammaproteobacteria bacterium]|nr:MAG: cytochrome-c oxidase, cbb3-type subunit III [Gammaproteobacteria bacterium]